MAADLRNLLAWTFQCRSFNLNMMVVILRRVQGGAPFSDPAAAAGAAVGKQLLLNELEHETPGSGGI